jgi:hypothetical protein
MNAMSEQRTISTLFVAVCICAIAALAGCSETQVYRAARPTSASLMIEVIGPDGVRRWAESRRIEYRYPEDELVTLGGNTEGDE